MGEFRMPSLGADMTEGTLLEWLVKPGDTVHRGDIIAVVDTSKSAIDIEVFEDGTVTDLLVEPGTTVPVGAAMAILSGPAPAEPAVRDAAAEPTVDVVPVSMAEPVRPPMPEPVREPVLEPPPAPTRQRDEAHIAASPFARRRAAELGVDLTTVTGHGGVISVADVLATVQPVTGADHSDEDHSATGHAAPDHAAAMREAIGKLMARSKKEIPHYYLQTTIDMRVAMEWLFRLNAERAVADRILPAALLLKATAVAVHEVPGMNGFYVDGSFRPADHVHIGVAVSLRGGGLIAPALHEADTLPLDELMSRMKDLVTRARSGRLRSSEMSDPTITVTNLGEQGAELVHGVIYPPQVALVGFGRIVERPVAVDGMLAVHPTVTATLAADHRVTDGHRGGLLLAAIDAALQSPDSLLGGRT